MKPTFQVRVVKFSTLREIDGVWTPDDFTALLDKMDFGETNELGPGELREMCLMSLQDLEPQAAAALVLEQHLGDRLTQGQIRNAADEMSDEKLWEEYADMSLHEGMFNVGSLLYAASPKSFPEPDAVHVSLEVVATNDAARKALARALDESFLVRLLSEGMDDKSVLHRLFDQQLDGKSFPEASTIVWILRTEQRDADTAKIEVTSSGYWLDPLRETSSYESSAYSDDTD